MEAHTLPYVKWIASGNLLCDSGNSNQGSVTTWRVGMRGRFQREGTYVYLWLIHADVRQKPIQCDKAIIPQLKLNKCLSSVSQLCCAHFKYSEVIQASGDCIGADTGHLQHHRKFCCTALSASFLLIVSS